jgi:hypothetical protein
MPFDNNFTATGLYSFECGEGRTSKTGGKDLGGGYEGHHDLF